MLKVEFHVQDWVILLKSKTEEGILGKEKKKGLLLKADFSLGHNRSISGRLPK